jgi:hypothetical protein
LGLHAAATASATATAAAACGFGLVAAAPLAFLLSGFARQEKKGENTKGSRRIVKAGERKRQKAKGKKLRRN